MPCLTYVTIIVYFGLTAGRPGNCGYISGRAQHPDRLWGPLSLLSNGYRGFFPHRVKRLGREAYHSPPSSAEVKKVQHCISNPPIRLHGVVLN
jgi:hypothetical protein